MDIVSYGPLRTTGFEWQVPGGGSALTVVCKATFELLPGESRLAHEQEAPNDEDVYWDDDPSRSLCSASDLAPYKPRADVVLVGHAYAPKQQPTRSFRVRLIVGEVDKSIEVWCHRGFRVADGQMLEGPRIARMDLRWERASGGPGTLNPVGKRFDGTSDPYGTVSIGNLEPPGIHVASRRDTFVPVCFAPIAPDWPSRVQRLHRHARTFSARGWEKTPLPADFDYGYFNIAPPDQQVAELRPDERIVLQNLHSEHDRLVTSLPGIRPRAIADRATGEREEIALTADTLWIDTDRGICTMVWRGRMGLRHSREAGRVAFWVDGMEAIAPEIEPGSAGGATMTIVQGDRGAKGLPFVPGAAVLGGDADVLPAWARALDKENDGTGTIMAGFAVPAKDPLPFARGAPDMPKGTPAPSWMEMPALVPMEPEPETARGEPGGDRKPLEGARFAEVAPPAMVGPLATPERVSKDEPEPEKEEPFLAEPPKPVLPVVPAEKKPGPEEFGLERCASLTAHIARNKPDKAKILKEEGLTAGDWAAIEKHWVDAIQGETRRGKKALLDRFDAAYVDQLEKERGPIQMEEYAQLMVAAERGTANEVLAELGLPRGAMMRIDRVWMKKFARDASLGDRASEAVERAREG